MRQLNGGQATYPAGIRVQESPPDTVGPYLFHPPASVKEHSQHPLAQVDNLLILLGVRRVRCVVGHRVLLWNGRNDECRM
jgi:hypothetical protein